MSKIDEFRKCAPETCALIVRNPDGSVVTQAQYNRFLAVKERLEEWGSRLSDELTAVARDEKIAAVIFCPDCGHEWAGSLWRNREIELECPACHKNNARNQEFREERALRLIMTGLIDDLCTPYYIAYPLLCELLNHWAAGAAMDGLSPMLAKAWHEEQGDNLPDWMRHAVPLLSLSRLMRARRSWSPACPECDGTGAEDKDGDRAIKCSACNGTGFRESTQ